jgi:hypothetical protein
MVFTRHSTRDPKELETYRKMAPATLAGHPVNIRVSYGHHEVVEVPKSKAWSSSNFRPSKRQRRGTTVPPIGKHANIASKGAEYRAVIVQGV